MTWQTTASVLCSLAMIAEGNAEPKTRPVIYQLLVRTFGNTAEHPKPGGTIAENGCGKFADINDKALVSLRAMGFTHLWLTGIHEQASATPYPGRPGDDPDILKGLAGSPYAIRDSFDVCPDYATDPAKRMQEFRDLVARCHTHGFKVLIDFVPNHVARSHASDVRPDLSFGTGDRTDRFFDRDNHFFYLQPHHPGGGPPLRLPAAGQPGCDGHFEPENRIGRVTGNNVVSWAPSIHDWYETVKLNYGHDFTTGRDTSHLPGPASPPEQVPKTWRTMDAVLAHWQEAGVDGFRVDMAHMVPSEFWRWVLPRARARDADAVFTAEAYDNDPAKLTNGNVLDDLLHAGFDAVYDDPSYDILEGIYDDGKWSNDLDPLTFTGFRFHRSLRYTENHDEVRLANPQVWGGHGMLVGRPASAVLFGMGRGPLMMYHGQEVGEAARGAKGFCGDNARTSIFDYGPLPELRKWFNQGACDGALLSPEQKALREWYARLLQVTARPAFTRGEFYGLNHANRDNPRFGRMPGEEASGHWLYAFLRRDTKSREAFLVIANFHPAEILRGGRVRIPREAREFLGRSVEKELRFEDRLATPWKGAASAEELEHAGIPLPDLPPLSALMIEISG